MAEYCPSCGAVASTTSDQRYRCSECALLFRTTGAGAFFYGPAPDDMTTITHPEKEHRLTTSPPPLNPPAPDEWLLEFLGIERKGKRQ